MAPQLVQRDYYYSCNNINQYGDCYYSSWDRWGRWAALVGVIIFVLFVAILFSCINARRRRSQGLPPRYGTGWAANKWGTQQQPYYPNQPYNGGAPAPPYSPPVQNQQPTGNTFNSNEGYYGQQTGVELQPPKNTYTAHGGNPVYEEPQGPPPSKGYGGSGYVR